MRAGPVIHVDDHEMFRTVFAETLDVHSGGRYKVEYSATNRDEAFRLTDRIHGGIIVVKAMFLDGSLGSKGADRYSEADDVAKRVRQLNLPIWIIRLSSYKLSDLGMGVNVHIQKPFSGERVVEVLDELPEWDPDLVVYPIDDDGGFVTSVR